jgi:pimeloyl-ACP methyl ester carboxylesterase
MDDVATAPPEPTDGYDWGARSPRWAGVRSEWCRLGGMRVHLLRAAAAPGAPPDAPAQVLLHPLGTGAWSWLEVMGPLTAYGPVMAPDLPGSGHTRPAHRRFASADHCARFVTELLAARGLDRVTLHGHSMGGLVAVLVADLAPTSVRRLVLAAAPLPGRPDRRGTGFGYRVALAAGQPVARVLMRVGLRSKVARVRRRLVEPDTPLAGRVFAGTDLTAFSPEFRRLLAEELLGLRLPWRADGALAGITAAFSALTVRQAAVRAVIDRLTVPTLFLWGDRDRFIPRELVDELVALRPDWRLEVLPTGHLITWEAPDRYVAAVGP